MTPERWTAVERLYHAALERSPIERAAFLDSACGGDDGLRREVESLIAHGTAAPHILDVPAGGNLRALIAARLAGQGSAPGRHVGRVFDAYELQGWIAAGGMGEVYRAVDTRLKRTVAIKVLPPHLSGDADRQELFRHEAQIISSLNHPHICTIHDIGVQDDGLDYIVMEYIEGETLQQRLTRGALPLPRALEYAAQIVDALDKAHRRGIIHRDLKPANVMITAVGVKLLDFGIATRIAGETGVDDMRSRDSDGLTSDEPAMATPQYGSPEQLDARRVDARTDIFSFGATIYEMITGRRAFQGDTRVELVDHILHDEPPPIRDLAPAVPTALARTLSRCLAKDPDERWQTANDLLFELRSHAASGTEEKAVHTPPGWMPRWTERGLWGAAVLAALLVPLVFMAPRVGSERVTPDSPDIRFDILPESGTSLSSSFDVPFALAPDGRSLAYVAVGKDSVKRLWLRRFDGADAKAQEIPGTEEANTPFWSPDGEWVGFFSHQRLLKLRVSTARVQVIAEKASTMGGATWNADGVILFPAGPRGLSRVSADGGPLSLATAGDGSHFWPQFMADGKHFLYAAALRSEIRVGSLTGESPSVLMKVPVRISSLGYTRGYLFYGQDASLFARSFNETTLEVSGVPVHLLDGIPITQLGRMPFSVSAAGSLAFWPYGGGMPATLQWFGDDGRVGPPIDAPARYVGVALAPDGQRAAFSRRNADGGADVWIRDLRGSAETQLTFDGVGFAPRWSADGSRIAFTGTGKLPPKLGVKNLDQPGTETQIGESPLPTFASSWCRDGKRIVSVRIDPDTHDDLYVEDIEHGGAERLPINTAGNDYQGTVSPDDRWLAYVTDDSGRDEVWVASFPSGRITRQVSTNGGTSPQWTAGGREISYISAGKWLTVRSFSGTDTGIGLDSPRELFDAAAFVETTPLLTPSANSYAAAVGGRRFLAAVRASDPQVPPIKMIVNWRALLRR
jgi:serine/threonine protein kinase